MTAPAVNLTRDPDYELQFQAYRPHQQARCRQRSARLSDEQWQALFLLTTIGLARYGEKP